MDNSARAEDAHHSVLQYTTAGTGDIRTGDEARKVARQHRDFTAAAHLFPHLKQP